MAEHKIDIFFSNEGSRKEVRDRVIEVLATEEAGTGTGENASRYRYYVETLSDGKRVYLQRPANLHYGFDFLVCVEDMNYAKDGKRKRNYPKHNDIETDLLQKREEDPEMYKALHALLNAVFKCDHDVTDEEIEKVQFQSGYSVDHLVKVIKWLFIEQDIRYWNYTGRNRTWGIVPKPEQDS